MDELDGTGLTKLVDNHLHEPFGLPYDVDQLGYGLQYVGGDTDELWYVSRNRGIFRIINPKSATPETADSLHPLYTYQVSVKDCVHCVC